MTTNIISFPGILNPQRAIVTRTVGTHPDVSVIYAVPQDFSPDTSGTSPFTFGSNGYYMTWTNCLCDKGTMFSSSLVGHTQVFSIKDRRWIWEKAWVNHAWNVKQPDGSIMPGTFATLKEIVQTIFYWMEELSPDLSLIESIETPEIIADVANCADLLEDILEPRGYVVTLLADDSVAVVPRGWGQILPNNGDVVAPAYSLDPPEIPEQIVALCGKTMVQSTLALIPVGIDTDYSVKPIEELTYVLEDGWANADFGVFNGIADPFAKSLAQKTVGKWFQVVSQADGTQELGEYLGQEIAVESPSQYLPLEPKLLATYTDISGNQQKDDPIISGTFFLDDKVNNPPQNVNSNPFTVYEAQKWKLDRARGIVMFDKPVLQLDQGVLYPAELYLTCSYSVHSTDTFMKDKFFVYQNLGGIGTDVIRADDLQRQIIATYVEGEAEVEEVFDNADEVATEAQNLLATAVNRYTTQVANLIKYRGTYIGSTDGINLQIKWECAVPGDVPWSTTVSQSLEGIPMLPTQSDKALARKARAYDAIDAARRKYHLGQNDVNF